MKKAVITGVLSLFSISLAVAQAGSQELPQQSKDFIAQHFPNEKLTYVEKDKSWLPWDNDDMYEVHFSSGLEMSFNKAGEITEIDAAQDNSIPAEVVPSQIRSYISANYPDVEIESWNLDGKDQEVELSNGVDLEFDKNGKFKRVD